LLLVQRLNPINAAGAERNLIGSRKTIAHFS
jgi:hypothetical protein